MPEIKVFRYERATNRFQCTEAQVSNTSYQVIPEGKTMEFEGQNLDRVIDLLKVDQEAFGEALVKMQQVDNYDNRIPSGLVKFAKFFYAHHKEVYANGKNTEVVHKLFLKWLAES